MKTLLSQNSHKHFTALGSSELNWIPRSSKLGARQALEDKSKTMYSRAASAAAYVINSIIKFIVLCHFSQGFLDCQPNLRYHFCFSCSSLRNLNNAVKFRNTLINLLTPQMDKFNKWIYINEKIIGTFRVNALIKMHRRAILNTNIQRFFKNKRIKISTANDIPYLLDFTILYLEDKWL